MADTVSNDRTKRNWKAENRIPAETLGKIMDADWVDDIDDELDAMNSNKPGRPFEYSDSMVVWGMRIKTMLGLDYRTAHGLLTVLTMLLGINGIGYTRFYERGRDLALSKMTGDITDGRILAKGVCCVDGTGRRTLAVDSTGLRMGSRGEWMTKIWNGRRMRGWLKLHVVSDVDTNEVLAFILTTERCGDNTCFMMLMDMLDGAGYDIGKVLGDAAYDSRENWNVMKERKIEFVANMRGNANGKFNGCSSRGLQALRRAEVGEKQWKIEIGYGRRWKVECTFSDFKRLFGESLTTVKQEYTPAEIFWKIDCLNIWKGIRKGLLGVC